MAYGARRAVRGARSAVVTAAAVAVALTVLVLVAAVAAMAVAAAVAVAVVCSWAPGRRGPLERALRSAWRLVFVWPATQ